MNGPPRWRRAIAALTFGATGALLPVVWFLPGIVRNQDGVALLLYIALPGFTAAVAGAAIGATILDPRRIRGAGRAAGRGAAVAALAILLFVPLFETAFAWMAPGRTAVFGVTAFVLFFGAMSGIWAAAVVVGALVGWLLFRLTRDSSSAERAG